MRSNFFGSSHSNKYFLFLLVFCGFIFSHPLKGGESFLYQIYSDRGELSSNYSQSKLFWDNIAFPFDSSLTVPDTALYMKVSPLLQGSLSNKELWYDKSHFIGGYLAVETGTQNIFVYTKLDVRSDFKGDPYYLWKKDREIAPRVDEAYGQINYSSGFLRFGRQNRSWGPFHDRSLLLSSVPYSYNAFEWQFEKSWLQFRHLFAALPHYFSSKEKRWEGIEEYNRYLSVHTLNILLSDDIQFGASEAILFGRTKGFPDFNYMNPFIPYAGLNGNGEAGAGNVMFEAHSIISFFQKLFTLKGQIFIDDIQIDNKTIQDQEPLHWGMLTGGYLVDFIPKLPLKHSLAIEYSYLSKWLYTVTSYNAEQGETYILGGKSLGHEWIDGDSLAIRFSLQKEKKFLTALSFETSRKDTNDFFSDWPIVDGVEVQGYRDEEPLSSRITVKRTIAPSLQGEYALRDWCFIEGKVRAPFISLTRDDDFEFKGVEILLGITLKPKFDILEVMYNSFLLEVR